MCLAVPGKLIEILPESDPIMGTVDFSGVQKKVCLALTPEASLGQYLIVHAGFSITILNEEEAKRTLALLEQ